MQECSGISLNPRSVPILAPALRSLIVDRLQKSLEGQAVFSPSQYKITALEPVGLSLPRESWVHDVPLNRIKVANRLEYVSALAFKLQPLQSQSALRLAQQIAAILSSPAEVAPVNATEQIWQHFVISVQPPGWIHFQLADPGLAAWLQTLGSCSSGWSHLEQTKPNSADYPSLNFDRNGPEVFAAMHSHARCWTLLHLAAEETLIQIAETRSGLGVVFDQPIPWLAANQQLRFGRSEWNLVLQISDTIDYLSQPKATATQQSLKAMHSLSQAFQAFHAACRIWGEIKLQDPPLVQVRLGLMAITQTVLHTLLTETLGLEAPSSL